LDLINYAEEENKELIYDDIIGNLERVSERVSQNDHQEDPLKYWGRVYVCDACFKPLKSSWYHCIECSDDYDECTECRATKDPGHPHKMVHLPYGLLKSIKLREQSNLLCFDGGGIRGYLAMLMFEEYMKKLMKKMRKESKHEENTFLIKQLDSIESEEEQLDYFVRYIVPRKFNLVCGTSIGGIIAMLLGLEVPLSLIKKTFQSKKYEIFPPKGKFGKIFEALKDTVSGETTYSNAGLRSLFYELAKDRIPMEQQDQATDKIIYKDPKQLTLKDLKFPCGVLSYDLNINSVVYFTNITQECQNIKIEDAIFSHFRSSNLFPYSHLYVR